jgi:hypothetical protein
LYVDDRGRQRAIALEDAGEVDFGRTGPFRKPPAYRGQRNFPGWWWSVTTRSHVVYGSWLERHHIIEADRDARVTGIAGQPFALTWPLAKGQIRHVPDIFCRMLDGGVVTDCRPVRNADADFMSKCAVTAAACQVAGWAFRLVGEPDPVWAANLCCWPDTAIPGSPTLTSRSGSSPLSFSLGRWPKSHARSGIRSGCCPQCFTCCGLIG